MQELVQTTPDWHFIISQMPIPAICLDKELTVVQWNDFAEGLFGWTKEDTVGCSIANTLPYLSQDVPPNGMTIFEFALTYGCWKGELEQVHKGGMMLRLQISVSPVVDQIGRFQLWLITAQNHTDWHALDVTMRQTYRELETDLSERAKQFSEQKRQLRSYASHLEMLHRLDRAVLSAQTMSDITDKTLKMLRTLCYWWDAVSLVQLDLETTTAVFLGQQPPPPNDSRPLHTFSLRRYQPQLAQLAEGKPLIIQKSEAFRLHAVFLKHLQMEQWNTIIIVPLIADDQLIALLTIASHLQRPISPQMENIVLEMGYMFSKALYRVLQMHHLQERLKSFEMKNKKLTQFAHVASHDLQEPLRTVEAYMTLLARRYGSDLPPGAMEFVTYAQEGANRMKVLIDDLLRFSQIDNELGRREQVDCTEAVQSAVSNLCLAIEERGATLHFGPLPTLCGHRTQIVLLFQNLISNALKYCSERQPLIEIRCVSKGVQWEFCVEDNGIGIELSRQREIFELLRRLHSHEQIPGSGVGLAICKKIVEQHNGRIWLTSIPNQGSSFFFTIPQD